MNVDHVGIVVADLEDSGRFMENVLGLRLRSRDAWPDYGFTTAFYRCGNAEIELIEVHDPAMRSARLGDARARIEHIALRVGDLDHSAATFAANGVRLHGVPTPTGFKTEPLEWGARRNLWTDESTTGGIMYQLVEDHGEQ